MGGPVDPWQGPAGGLAASAGAAVKSAGRRHRLPALLLATLLSTLAGTAAAQQGPGSLGRGYDPLAPLRAPTPMPPAPAGETSDEYGGLPAGEGVDLTYYLCGACHSIQLVTQQRVTRARWDYLLDWMVEKQGMAPLPPEDRTVVLDYLSRHFSSGG